MKIKKTREYIENMIILCQLKFERAMDKFDIHDANIACAQKEFWEKELTSPD